MKAIHVNLASRPYRDNRAYLISAGLLGAVVLILTLINAWTTIDYLSNTQDVREDIAALEQQIAETNRATAAQKAQLEGLNYSELNRRIEYVNTQIAERAFSWNSLLNDLERVLPGDVRITQLRPAVMPDGSVQLNLVLEAKSQEGIIRLLDQMLSDPSFSRAFPRSEQVTETGLRLFNVEAEYRGEGVALR